MDDPERRSLALDRRFGISTAQGLMERSPEMLALCAWLETPAGHHASCSAVSTIPAAAIVLAVVDRQEAAMKMTAAGILFVGTTFMGVFWECGKSLISAIDESIEMRKTRVEWKDGDGGNEAILAVRKKVRWTMGFAARQITLMGSVLAFAIFSKYGTAAPLLLFDIPMVIVTMIKQTVAVQLFAGKSKLDAPRRLRHCIGGRLRVFRNRKGRIVPTETSSALDHTVVEESHQIHLGLE